MLHQYFGGTCELHGAGGVWADQLVRWRAYRKHSCTIFVLILAAVLFLILGFIPFMDNFFHIIAFACGALLTSALLKPRSTRVSFKLLILHQSVKLKMSTLNLPS